MNTRIIEAIAEKSCEIAASKGGNHKFMGIDIEFLGNGGILLSIRYYIEESITSFREALDENVSSLAEKSLQNIN